jgi:hypothetical protein
MLDRLNLVTAGCCASNGSASKNVSHLISTLALLVAQAIVVLSPASAWQTTDSDGLPHRLQAN